MRPFKPAVYSSRTADKFVVRLPDGMRERITEVAKENHRSMNSEIIARLQNSLEQPNDGSVEVTAPDTVIWNPSVGNLVRAKLRTGQITQFRLSTGDVGDMEVQLDNLYWYLISDVKPIFLKG